MLEIKTISLQTVRYAATVASEFPSLFDPDGCYPYTQFCDTAETGREIMLQVVQLENDHLVAIVSPELNGRLLSLVDKKTGKEALYRNDAVKPNRILPRWGWFSGGIEFNYPIAHSPTALEHVGHNIFKTRGRVAVQCGETERRYGLSWIIELSLGENEDFLTQRSFFRNAGTVRRPWCFWTNAAVRSTPETKYLYPSSDHVLRHADVSDHVSWPEIGEREKDFDRMTGLFWNAKGYAFGCWHPEDEIGLLHTSDPSTLRGMKMWTYGIGRHSKWPLLFCDNGRGYAEIQSGVAPDQATEMFMDPGEEHQYIEFWKPVLSEPDIATVGLPTPSGEFAECHWIGRKHIAEVKPWDDFAAAVKANPNDTSIYAKAPKTPPPPLPEFAEPLEKAFAAAPDVWREHYAEYLLAVSEFESAYLKKEPDYTHVLDVLSAAKTAGEMRLLGLTQWKGIGNAGKGAKKIAAAHRLSKDVRLAVEYDECLAELGASAAEERKALHANFKSDDRRWIERQVALLLDSGKPQEAKDLLLSTKWDLYHLRHVRSVLYIRCQQALGLPLFPIPEDLGEDDMADWGAYRPQTMDGKKIED